MFTCSKMEFQRGFWERTVHWASYQVYVRLSIWETVLRPQDVTEHFIKLFTTPANYMWKDRTLHNAILSLILIYWANKRENTLSERNLATGRRSYVSAEVSERTTMSMAVEMGPVWSGRRGDSNGRGGGWQENPARKSTGNWPACEPQCFVLPVDERVQT